MDARPEIPHPPRRPLCDSLPIFSAGGGGASSLCPGGMSLCCWFYGLTPVSVMLMADVRNQFRPLEIRFFFFLFFDLNYSNLLQFEVDLL